MGGRAMHRTMYPFVAAELPDFDLGRALETGLLPLVMARPTPRTSWALTRACISNRKYKPKG